jgi:hypothetical protein
MINSLRSTDSMGYVTHDHFQILRQFAELTRINYDLNRGYVILARVPRLCDEAEMSCSQ